MTTYFGTWRTNNGNTFGASPIQSKNLRALRKDLRAIVSGNLTGPTDIGTWEIYTRPDHITTESVAHGSVNW